MRKLTIPALSDYHVHARQGEMLKKVLPHSIKQCGRIMLMPNTLPPITTEKRLVDYDTQVGGLEPDCDIRYACKLTTRITPQLIYAFRNMGCIAAKLYPEGVTTHSGDGVSLTTINNPYKNMKFCNVIKAMQECGMVLSIHAELPNEGVMYREQSFTGFLVQMLELFPDLKIVVEHVTTEIMAAFITRYARKGGKIAGTITPHHLRLTIDDVLTPKLQPHNYCMPVPKGPMDRAYLQCYALSSSGNFFLGSDSAPHLREHKECNHGCAGVYTAPIVAQLMADFFDSKNALARMHDFTSAFGDAFYGLPPTDKTITLVKKPMVIPEEYDGVVPFMAGKTLQWSLSNRQTCR